MLLSSSHGLLEILFETELRNVTLYYNFFLSHGLHYMYPIDIKRVFYVCLL